MRELIINTIKHYAFNDYIWKYQIVNNDKTKIMDTVGYEAWLNSLDDEDLLAAYDRVREANAQLD